MATDGFRYDASALLFNNMAEVYDEDKGTMSLIDDPVQSRTVLVELGVILETEPGNIVTLLSDSDTPDELAASVYTIARAELFKQAEQVIKAGGDDTVSISRDPRFSDYVCGVSVCVEPVSGEMVVYPHAGKQVKEDLMLSHLLVHLIEVVSNAELGESKTIGEAPSE